ncbi:MAG: DNA-binding response regulator [Cryomorphaceae bacterium]|nr:MAG: DNA-binding response regulator [Cryomorphaceae bacterium]
MKTVPWSGWNLNCLQMRKMPHILVVEDDPVVADDICACLAELRYQVVGPAYSIEAALALCAEHEIDLALLDIHLRKHSDGIELAKRIREQMPVPIIFLTASGDNRTLADAKEIHPEQYLLKPFNAVQLKAALEIVFFNLHNPDSDYDMKARIAKFNKGIPDPLSDREVDVVLLLLKGASNADMAEQLFISLHTVKSHIKRIFLKTGAESRTHLISLLNQL